MKLEQQQSERTSKVINLSRDVCFWMVPPHDGRVRKFRCTLGRILAASFVVATFLGLLLFIAGDYARLQLLRARIFYSLRAVTDERNTLVNHNSTLRSEVEDLQASNSRADAFERNVKARLAELEAILGSSNELGLLGAKDDDGAAQALLSPSEVASGYENAVGDEGSDGMGGPESDCDGHDCVPTGDVNLDATLDGNRASLSWNHLGAGLTPARVRQVGINAALVNRLDRRIDLLRKLPLGLPGDGHIRSGFGVRISPFTKKFKMHEGIDLSLPAGSYIYATGDGVVRDVGRNNTYGLRIDLDHSNSIVTRYAHLSRVFVSEGERVCKGEAIALVGSSGRSTGPHLHYEVIVNGHPRNPVKLFELAKQLGRFQRTGS